MSVICTKCGELVEDNLECCPYCNHNIKVKKENKPSNISMTGNEIKPEDFSFNEPKSKKQNNNELTLATGTVVEKDTIDDTKEITGPSENLIHQAMPKVPTGEKIKFENPFFNSMKNSSSVNTKKEINNDISNKSEVIEEKELITPIKEEVKEDEIMPNNFGGMPEPTDQAISQPNNGNINIPPIKKDEKIKNPIKKKKTIFYVIGIIVTTLLLAVIGIVIYLNVYGNYETPVKNYFKALNNLDINGIIETYPPCAGKNEQFKLVLETLLAPQKEHKGLKTTYKIIKKEEMTRDEIIEQEESYSSTCAKGEVKLSKGYKLKVKTIQKENEKTEGVENTIDILVGKIDKKWYIVS